MKKIFLVLAVMLFSTIAFSQQIIKFHAYYVTMTNLNTDRKISMSTDILMTISNNYVIFNTGRYWTIVSDITYESKLSFYIYAIDNNNGSRCRIWFKTKDSRLWDVILEYSDFRFFYLCNYIQ